ncbi:putative lipoprotein [Archangium gephyra]|uniref:Lipoprotein n=1 Tax=Archangium gephyra TaxID=48 RepID=A0AAC8Q542_9BACT|nr:putative lipoprotein [Archangium gephyra]
MAYVELQHPEAPAGRRVGGWNALFVVNADGTGRRKLVDLTQLLLPEGQRLRAGSFIWSDDGNSLAYVLASLPKQGASLKDCSQVTLHSVDVVSGRGATLSEARPLGSVALLGWYPARAEAVLYGECGYPEEPSPAIPIPNGSVTVLRVSDGTASQRLALKPSLSPAGSSVFIPSHPRALAGPPTLYRTDALGGPPTVTLTLPRGHLGRIHWMHRAPAALLSSTEWELPFLDCVGTQPQPRVLFRLDLGTGTLQRVREDARRLNVLAISPDDTHALVGIITGEDDRFHPPCVSRPVERLFLVRLDEIASELPIQELRRRARPLTPPRLWSDVAAFNEYVGWVR